MVGADGDDGDEAVGGAVIEATKQRSDGWFPPLKGTHGLRPGDLIAATEKGQTPFDNYVMICQIKGGGERRARSPLLCLLLAAAFCTCLLFFCFFPPAAANEI